MGLFHDRREGSVNSLPDSDDAKHAALDADWHKAFNDLRAAGLESDADHPVAARYRAASAAVNHSNRKRDYGIFTGQIKS